MLTADGKQSGEIPEEKIEDAIRAGFHLAVEMVHSATGQRGLIPSHRTKEALANGFRHVKK
jgi:hypothetical protein